MGVYRRVSDIMAANLNDLLDRAEDPDKMLKQIIREMEEGLQAAKRDVGRVLASQKKLENEIHAHERLRDEWQSKAEQAVDLGRDDLARQALAKKNEHARLCEALERQHADGDATARALREGLRGLEAKLADAKRRRLTLAARKKTAQAQVVAHDQLGNTAGAAAFAKFERFEEQVDDLEAEAGALAELSADEAAVEAEFAELDQGADIEIELEQLKARKGKAKG